MNFANSTSETLILLCPTQAFCSSLEFCLDCIHTIRVDLANNKLRAIAPAVISNGIEYVRSHFSKKLGAKQITLEGTKAWVAASMRISIEEQQVCLQDLLKGSAPAYEAVLRVGFVHLISSSPSPSPFPETMLLDRKRIEGKLRRLFDTQVSCAAAMLAANQLCMPNAGQILGSLASAAAASGCLQQPAGGDERAILLDLLLQTLRQHCNNESLACRAEALVRTHMCSTTPVHKLLVRRVRDHWIELLGQQQSPEAAAAASRLPDLVRGCIAASVELTGAGVLLRRMFSINRNVHIQRYNSLIREAAEALAAAE